MTRKEKIIATAYTGIMFIDGSELGELYKYEEEKMGHTSELISQILFAMCRYPVVEEVIKECAKRFDEVNRRAGHIARATVMDHLIDETVECKEVKR